MIDGLNVRVDRTETDAYIAHVTAAAANFATCAVPNPDEMAACLREVMAVIREDMSGPTSDDEVYLRYVHIYPEGASLNGEYAAGDAAAIAACAT